MVTYPWESMSASVQSSLRKVVELIGLLSLCWGKTNTLVSDAQVTGGVWNFSRVCCDVFVTLDVMMCTASILNLCAISIDR